MAHPRAGPPTTSPERFPGLHERDVEIGRIAAALDSASKGNGELLLIEGPPGIGKTALLHEAQRMAAAHGLQVLGARASEIDRDLAFGAMRQVLEPPLRRAGIERRRELLAGNAGLAAVALGLSGELLAPESAAATLHGIFWLLSNLVEDAPLLITIDDVHWADAATARLLTFLAPRLEDIGCLMIVTARVDEPVKVLALAGTASDPAARALVPAPLSERACATIVAERFRDPVGPTFAAACHTVSGGNPFYLHALIDELLRDDVAPTAASAHRVLAVNPSSVSRTIVARLATLGLAAAAFARALAVLGDETDSTTVAWLAGIDASEAIDAVEMLEGAGIVAGGDRIDFVHPVVRNAVYADLGRTRRAELHHRAAECLGVEGAPPERIAAHIVPIPPSGDASDLSILRRAATDALGRGAPDSAVAYLRRAMAEPLTDTQHASVILQLGVAETATDLGAATEHLQQAFELTEDSGRRALIAAVLARAVFFTDRSRDCIRVAREAIADLDPAAAELRRGLEAIVLAAASMEPAEQQIADELAVRLRATGIEGDDFAAKALEAALVHLEARASLPASEAVRRMEHALRGNTLLAEDNGRAAFCAAAMVLALADSERALPLLETGIAAALKRGDLLAVAGDQIFACLAHLVRGQLADAIASGEEGLAHTETNGGAVGIPWGSGFLAAAYLERGDLDAAENALGRAHASGEVPDNAHWHVFLDSRARLRAQRGDLRGSLDEALECGRRFESVGGSNPAFLPWRSRVARCLAGLGEDAPRARRLAAEEVELARAWGAPRTLGVALRVQGLVSEGDAGVGLLRAAVEVLEGSPARLEHARAQVDLGARLRRMGKRSEAREPLATGLDLARSCGALPLAERAYEELRASGARPRKILLAGIEALTPSELRVARLAARGSTNREIAQELFVTRKTIEFHLGHVYRKLDISSREELSDALGT